MEMSTFLGRRLSFFGGRRVRLFVVFPFDLFEYEQTGLLQRVADKAAQTRILSETLGENLARARERLLNRPDAFLRGNVLLS